MKLFKTFLFAGILVLGAFVPFAYYTVKASPTDSLIFPIVNLRESSSSVPVYPRGFSYPIGALGNCGSKTECFNYCEQLANVPVCAKFSEVNGFMAQGSSNLASKMAETMSKSSIVNSCTGMTQCLSMLLDPNHIQDLNNIVAMAQNESHVLGASTGNPSLSLPAGFSNVGNGTVSNYDTAFKNGSAPGRAQNMADLITYCGNSANSQECLDFQTRMGSINQNTADSLKNVNAITQNSNCNLNNSCAQNNSQAQSQTKTPVGTVAGATDQPYALDDCINSASAPYVSIQNLTSQQSDALNAAVRQCQIQADASGSSSFDDATAKQNAINQIGSIQDCLSANTNSSGYSRGIQQCLARLAQ